MPTNWKDVPRDPIADDDELEYLYHLAEVNKVNSTAGRTAFVSNQCLTPGKLKDEKKPPAHSSKELVHKKLTCIALLALISPLGLASSLHLLETGSHGF